MQNPFGEERREEHLRVFPEIEKNARLQSLMETHVGRLVLTILFALLLLSFRIDEYDLHLTWPMIVAVFWLGIWRGPFLPKLLIGILIIYFSGLRHDWGMMVSQSEQAKTAHGLYLQFNQQMGDLFLLYYGATLVLLGLLTWISLRFLRSIHARLPVFWLFFIWAAWMVLAVQLPSNTIWSLLAWLTEGMFSLCLFSIAYFSASQASESKFLTLATFSLQTILMSPPFTVIQHPNLLSQKNQPMSAAVCQLKAFKLLAWSRLLATIAHGLRYLVFSKMGWVHFNAIGLVSYNALHLNWYQVLLTRVTQTLIFLLGVSINTGIGISLFRLAGVYLPRAVCRPYLARSFNEYFRRCLFYYSETILHLFFYPIYEKIYLTIRNRQWRMQAALFASLVIGGWIFHLVITWQSFFFFGARASLENALGWLPYFVLVGLACCLSASGFLSHRLRAAPLAAHFAINLLIHAMLMSFFQYSLGETLENRIQFIRSMMPF